MLDRGLVDGGPAAGRESLLSLIPHRFNTVLPGGGVAVGVAGWNAIELLVPNDVRSVCRRLDTLLGPEKTPVGVSLGGPSLAWPA